MTTTFVAGQPQTSYRVEVRAIKPFGLIKVEAWLPESFGFGLDSTFGPFMQNGQLLKGKMGEVLNDASQMLAGGLVLQSQAATAQLYQGSGYAQFVLPLEFVAETDTDSEVMTPIKNLMRMVAPTKGAGGLLVAPVSYDATFNPKNYVSLTIGKWFHARELICKNVQPVFEPMMEKGSGTPIKAKCDVTFETMRVPTIDDILEWFVS